MHSHNKDSHSITGTTNVNRGQMLVTDHEWENFHLKKILVYIKVKVVQARRVNYLVSVTVKQWDKNTKTFWDHNVRDNESIKNPARYSAFKLNTAIIYVTKTNYVKCTQEINHVAKWLRVFKVLLKPATVLLSNNLKTILPTFYAPLSPQGCHRTYSMDQTSSKTGK